MQYSQNLAQGMSPNEDFKCYILQQLLTQKAYCPQAVLDSIEVSESEVDDNLNNRLNVMTRQAGGKERAEQRQSAYIDTEVEIGEIVMYPVLTKEEKEASRKRAEDLSAKQLWTVRIWNNSKTLF
ncbi:hypothetical protein FQR65_LT15419 [Abscondita terminalis]|nr:hypothetical protein FQR65_LT15419 [Abscondita terminalis]